MSGYRLVLPAPWVRVPLDGDLERTVARLMDGAMKDVPKELPPDQVMPVRRRAEADLLRNLQEARDSSGVDAYLPVGLMHGNRLNATFIVSSAVPDAMADEELTAHVVASLLTHSDSRPVTIDDTVWVRRERTVAASDRPGDRPEPIASFDTRRVEYRAPVPGDVRRWITVAFTTGGDGDLGSRTTALVVDLFDAIMGTWRWSPDDPALMAKDAVGRRDG